MMDKIVAAEHSLSAYFKAPFKALSMEAILKLAAEFPSVDAIATEVSRHWLVDIEMLHLASLVTNARTVSRDELMHAVIEKVSAGVGDKRGPDAPVVRVLRPGRTNF